jgi:mRNA interferase MazF
MTAYRRGDIVLVPFPFSDQTTVKKRPAVIISSARFNAASQDIIIMAVTSRLGRVFDIGECMVPQLLLTQLP